MRTTRKIYLMLRRKASMLEENDSTTIAMKITIESHCRGFFRAAATLGRKWLVRMPSTSGIPRRMKIVLNTSQSGITRVGISLLMPAKWRYTLPHAQKLNGVMNTARAVEMAVSETESSMLAFARELMKLEMLPPGQAATRIMPIAIMGDIHPVMSIASPQVKAGRSTSWLSMSRSTDLGFLKTSTKMPGLMPRATPYITNARMIFMVFIPPALSDTLMLSMVLIISGAILCVK